MEWKLKHNGDKVLEAIAKVLKRDMGINPMQVLRHFQLFPMAGLEDFLPDHAHDYENWYQIKDSMSHEVLFNYETEEYVLMYPDDFWTEAKIEFLKKSEEDLEEEKAQYIRKMEIFQETSTYKKIKPIIEWYSSCPNLFNLLDSTRDFIKKLISKRYRYFKIDDFKEVLSRYHLYDKMDEDVFEEITRTLFGVYHYEKRQKKN